MEYLNQRLASYKKSHRRIVIINIVAGLIGTTILGAAALLTWDLQAEIAEKRALLDELNEEIASLRGTRLEDSTIVVGRKNFLEQDILSMIVVRTIKRDLPALQVVREPRRDTRNNYNRLLLGQIDLYVEYTGTAIVEILGLPVERARGASPEALNALFAQHRLEWLEPFGFNNSYAVVMLEETADSLGIRTLSDLGRLSRERDLRFALEDEFKLRKSDGYRALRRTYDLAFDEERLQLPLVDKDFKLGPVLQKEVEVGIAYTADPELALAEDPLIILEDDKGFFPPYYAIPVVHQDVLEAFPEIRRSLEALGGTISERDIATLVRRARDAGVHRDTVPEAAKEELLRDIVDEFLARLPAPPG